jgi:hypothetical protein
MTGENAIAHPWPKLKLIAGWQREQVRLGASPASAIGQIWLMSPRSRTIASASRGRATALPPRFPV